MNKNSRDTRSTKRDASKANCTKGGRDSNHGTGDSFCRPGKGRSLRVTSVSRGGKGHAGRHRSTKA